MEPRAEAVVRDTVISEQLFMSTYRREQELLNRAEELAGVIVEIRTPISY